ncbi:ABC transporter permease [Acetobacter thailandicus]|uniref:ABC transporter permease n=1 Tax=Acetobacter thailandicus TaxID=1502842 RepID=A0ABT3QE55_9PROT|nr:ABC transporter permease [Acetobacter thailandicus]MBS0960616.1 ABC transporter permease [Acetobacter thailandicus]MCX2563565.1 ABC transporter permease [Acetobacter thailandicus]NHN94318.1 ABC transporter permease subunit [Acetobacter thailandicus]
MHSFRASWRLYGRTDRVSRQIFGVLAVLLPLLIWSSVSYLPFVWHPQIMITDPGGEEYLEAGMRMNKSDFARAVKEMQDQHQAVPKGVASNPVYLPSPGQVLKAFVNAFTSTASVGAEHSILQAFWHSIRIIFWGFLISSVIGVPLGVFCGAIPALSRLLEPFVDFFRYLPAPAFGALAVAILGIYDAPKIAIIVIGTLFQQVLVIANTTRQLDFSLVEASRTLGAKGFRLLFRVVIPGILPDLYKDQRILLGWAWTYLIVAELIGTSSGITWFITQQARYQHFDNVFAAIALIGVVGLGTDIVLGLLGRKLFTWKRENG